MFSSLFATLLPLLAAAAFSALDYVVRPAGPARDRDKVSYQALALLGVALSLYGDITVIRVILVLLFAASFALGHGYQAITGDTLRPEGLILATHRDHFADALEVVGSDFHRAAAIFLAAGAWGAIVLALTIAVPPPDLGWPSALLGPIAIAAVVIRAVRLRNHAAYPHAGMPVLLGVINAFALAGKSLVLGQRRGKASAPRIRYHYDFDAPGGPVLVAILMGESISPDRMSIFQPGLPTTPLLAARARGAGSLRMFWRLGLSGAVSSNASLTKTLSGLLRPELGTNHKTLFELAKAQGFGTHFLSPQPRSPLDMTGRLQAVDEVATRENFPELVAAEGDFMINRKLEAAELSEHEFFVLYQRVNHAPYRNHDEAGRVHGLKEPRTQHEIIHNYDIGLAAWDRHTDSVLAEIERRLALRPDTRCFVFVSSDHNEMLGDGGLWGHNISGRMECAVVPMLLFTNVPDDPIAQRFAAAERLDSFELSRLALAAMGVAITTEGDDASVSYVGNALPYGRSGHMTARVAEDGGLDVVFVVEGDRVQAQYHLAATDVPGHRGRSDTPGFSGCYRSPHRGAEAAPADATRREASA